MTCRTNVVDYRGPTISPWPGKSVRDAHSALLRAERIHDRTKSNDDWNEVQIALRAYIGACEAEGIAP